jgi:xanthine dehydrogenase iron-sulfur cluster and FAD-binding subunit A
MSRENFHIAAASAAEEVSPISDVRGSADYRRLLSANVLLRFWHEMDESSEGADEPADVPGGSTRLAPVLRNPEGAQ